jgi:hypothetical protein
MAFHAGIVAAPPLGRKDIDPMISAKRADGNLRLDFQNKMRTLWVHN